MVIFLMGIFLVISLAIYSSGESRRKKIKLTLSITLSIILPLIIYTTYIFLYETGIIEGLPLYFFYYVLPIVAYTTFQIILYDNESK
jgi:hypothetical protein